MHGLHHGQVSILPICNPHKGKQQPPSRCPLTEQTPLFPEFCSTGSADSNPPVSRVARPHHNRETRLNLETLDRAVEFYFQNGLAPSSQWSYKSAKQWYMSFCVGSGVDLMPAIEQKLCRYVSFLAQEGLAPSSIKLYLSAVRHLQISLHLPDPKIKDMARLEQVVKGTKSVFAKHHPGT